MATGDFWGRVFGGDGVGGVNPSDFYKKPYADVNAQLSDVLSGTVTVSGGSGVYQITSAVDVPLKDWEYDIVEKMILPNPFSSEVREVYRYNTKCFQCGLSAGGVELHHIWGRVSSSIYNAIPVCRECHSHMGHSKEEHARLFALNSVFLTKIGYKATDYDMQFIDSFVIPIYNEITTCLRSMSTESTSQEVNTTTSGLPTLG